MGTSPPPLRSLVLVLVVVVSAAGLASLGGPPPTDVPQREVQTSDRANPYGDDVLYVHVDRSNLTAWTRGYVREVTEAMAYWERSDEPRVAWLQDMRLVADPDDAHVLVRFHDAGNLRIQGAAGPGALGLGSAGNATHPGSVELTMRIGCTEVRRSHAQVRALAIHELGHALGLEHGGGPGDPMWHGGGPLTGFPNPLELLVDSPNPLSMRLAGLVAPVTELPSCYLR